MNAPPSEETLAHTIDRFWETVLPTWNRIRGRIRTTAAEQFGITVEQFHILRHIRKGIRSVSDLAEAKGISRPAISQAVNMLVERDLITRRQNTIDRRCVELELTTSGNALLNTIFQHNRDWMQERLAVLSAAELDQLAKGMEILYEAFSEPPK